jgi:hypothetical protein
MNYILLSNRKRKHESLNFVGKSVLDGRFIYEILLDKINKNDFLINQLHCRMKNIEIRPEVILMHISTTQMKNTINVYNPYSY